MARRAQRLSLTSPEQRPCSALANAQGWAPELHDLADRFAGYLRDV